MTAKDVKTAIIYFLINVLRLVMKDSMKKIQIILVSNVLMSIVCHVHKMYVRHVMTVMVLIMIQVHV